LVPALRTLALALVLMLLFVGPAVAPATPGSGGFEATEPGGTQATSPGGAQQTAPDGAGGFDAAGAAGFRPSVLVVGDSLAVGMAPYLGGMLTSRVFRWDAASGRTTPQGLVALRERLREDTPQAVAVSLGTNDGSDPRRFARRITRVLEAIPPTACVVWANLNRPPR
jgi:hypothetical protein